MKKDQEYQETSNDCKHGETIPKAHESEQIDVKPEPIIFKNQLNSHLTPLGMNCKKKMQEHLRLIAGDQL